MTEDSIKVKPIIARDDQDSRLLDDGTEHILECPCADCVKAVRAEEKRLDWNFGNESREEPQDRADRIIAAWGRDGP